MAGTYRAQNNIASFSKEDASKENIHPKQSRTVNSRRPVLGNVTNQMRKQPQRVAKEKAAARVADGQENARDSKEKAGKVGPCFTIFEDAAVLDSAVLSAAIPAQLPHSHNDEPMLDQENLNRESNLVFSEAVASLGQIRRPRCHCPLELDTSAIASPMLVDDICRGNDLSLVQHDEFGLDPYFKDIYSYMRTRELQGRPSKDYMNHQNDVTVSMRNILVDWLVEVTEEYKLQRETLFLAVSYIDRFLAMVGVFRPKLQLVGAASMFIAAKYEEIYPPDIAEFVYITDDSYTKSQVVKMESVILRMLDFKVAVPTITWFCERYIEVLMEMSDKAKFLSFFLAELSLIEIEEFLVFPPSVLAASSIVIARCVLKMKEPWPQEVENISCYTLSELKPCIKLLHSQYARKALMPQQAVVEKYKQEKFERVSTIEPPHILAIL